MKNLGLLVKYGARNVLHSLTFFWGGDYIWVVVKIMVPFWVPIIIEHCNLKSMARQGPLRSVLSLSRWSLRAFLLG